MSLNQAHGEDTVRWSAWLLSHQPHKKSKKPKLRQIRNDIRKERWAENRDELSKSKINAGKGAVSLTSHPGIQHPYLLVTYNACSISPVGIKRIQFGFLSYGKLRASWGITGNDQIGDYKYLDTYHSINAYQGLAGLVPAQLFNPDYAWEENKKTEAGIELGLFSDHILLSVSYYRNRSSNQLVNYPLAATTGFSGILNNLGATVQNTGWEIEATTTNIRSRELTWASSINISIPNNKLIAFPGLESSTYASRYVVGEPLTIFKQYLFKGLDTQTGIFQFEDMNNDGRISGDDRMAIVNSGQQYYGGLNNTVRYKNWELDIFFQFVKQTGSNYLNVFSSAPGDKENQPARIVDQQWQKPGDNGPLQPFIIGNADAFDAFQLYKSSTAAFTDASFIRLKNVSLSYRIPGEWIKNVSGKFYLQGQNLLTITNYDGVDPENRSVVLPPLRTLVAGIQLTL